MTNSQNKKAVRERTVQIVARDLLTIRVNTQAAFLQSGNSYERAMQVLKPLRENLNQAIREYDGIHSLLDDAETARDKVDDDDEAAKDAAEDRVRAHETQLDFAQNKLFAARAPYNQKWDEIRGIIVGAALIVNTARNNVKQMYFRHKDIITSDVVLTQELEATQQAIGEMLQHLPAMPAMKFKTTKKQQELEEAGRIAKELHISVELVFDAIVTSLAIDPE